MLGYPAMLGGFGTIRNNTALKQEIQECYEAVRFGTIRNNTALKHVSAFG